jgi:hypothetical protein
MVVSILNAERIPNPVHLHPPGILSFTQSSFFVLYLGWQHWYTVMQLTARTFGESQFMHLLITKTNQLKFIYLWYHHRSKDRIWCFVMGLNYPNHCVQISLDSDPIVCWCHPREKLLSFQFVHYRISKGVSISKVPRKKWEHLQSSVNCLS